MNRTWHCLAKLRNRAFDGFNKTNHNINKKTAMHHHTENESSLFSFLLSCLLCLLPFRLLFSPCFCLSLCLSLCVVSPCGVVVVVGCGVWGVCVVCGVWHAENPCVCRHNAHTCWNMCARGAGIHWDVSNLHTETCLSGHRGEGEVFSSVKQVFLTFVLHRNRMLGSSLIANFRAYKICPHRVITCVRGSPKVTTGSYPIWVWEQVEHGTFPIPSNHSLYLIKILSSNPNILIIRSKTEHSSVLFVQRPSRHSHHTTARHTPPDLTPPHPTPLHPTTNGTTQQKKQRHTRTRTCICICMCTCMCMCIRSLEHVPSMMCYCSKPFDLPQWLNLSVLIKV